MKDIDFGYVRITVRDGKGAKDRVTMLPVNAAAGLERHLQKVKAQFEEDLVQRIRWNGHTVAIKMARRQGTRRKHILIDL